MSVGYIPINDRKLDTAYDLLKAVGHPLRIEILNFIGNKRETNVHGIYNVLDIPQSVTSQQLKVLKDAQVVLVERKHKERIYTLNYGRLEQIQDSLNTFFLD